MKIDCPLTIPYSAYILLKTYQLKKPGVGVASAAWEPCGLRLKGHIQKLISGQHAWSAQSHPPNY